MTTGDSIVLLFPGQGSQYPGMASGRIWEHPLGRAALEEADEVLGQSLSRLMRSGPAEELTLTENAQPAILAVSEAWRRVLAAERPELRILGAAGHSLGEYSALVASGVMRYRDALRLVRRRGQLMQSAVPAGLGGMLALQGASEEQAESICTRSGGSGQLEVAAWNSPQQIILAGVTEALDRAEGEARSLGVRARRLSVSAPFHCSLLEPAAHGLRPLLEASTLGPGRFPVFQNADGRSHADPEAQRSLLLQQVCSPVRWTDCVRGLAELGAARWVEPGPGRTLAGLMRRINRHWPGVSLDRAGALESL